MRHPLKTRTLKAFSLAAIASLSLLATPLLSSQPAQAGGRHRQVLEQLDLSDAQRAQIESIRSESREQMRAVLSAEQQALLDSRESEGRRVWRQLDLSDPQREEIRSIREATRTEVRSVLTEEQQAQLEELREQYGSGRRRDRPES